MLATHTLVGDTDVFEICRRKLDNISDIDDLCAIIKSGENRRIVLDLRRVGQAELIVVQRLATCVRRLEAFGIQFSFVNIDKIKKPEILSQIAMICPVFDNLAAAIRSMY